MITIKLTAADERTLKGAKLEAELRGAVDLVLARVEESKLLRTFGKEVKVKAKGQHNWQHAREVMGAVLGDNLRVPPFPDSIWYQRVYRTLRQYDMTDEFLTNLAEYARDNMKMPVHMEFLIAQHERVLAGEFNLGARRTGAVENKYTLPEWRKAELPEE